jgi:aminoglycoside/choline kinase family phosphotransferase
MQPNRAELDERVQALEAWASEELEHPVHAEPVATDAGFRRYFRFRTPARRVIAMDAPPEREGTAAFLRVAELLRDAGVHVPDILARDTERGFLLLTDLGERTWLQVLNEDNADERFPRALEALLCMQSATREGVLPEYDDALLRRELALFPDWYLRQHLQVQLDAKLEQQLNDVFDLLVEQALAQGRVWVHRDFMPRNLMDTEPDPGVIDFQDAVLGPISYDPICLFKDAFISWPEERVTQWLRQYWSQARAHGLPVPADFESFHRDCDLMGAHRHLKVLGIFARLRYRDGKPKYLEDAPRFLNYLHTVIARRPELAPLGEVLEEVGAEEPGSR